MYLPLRPLLAALPLAALPGLASAATFVVSTTVDATQEIVVDGTGNPGYYDTFNESYPFWEEYERIVTEEANVWDPSQIPATPDVASSDPLVSEGSISFGFTYDPDLIDAAALDGSSFTPYVGGTSVGTTGNLSATLSYSGLTETQFAPGPMSVFAADDFDTGVFGLGTIDALFVVVADETFSDGGSDYVFFVAGFDNGYFETLTGGALLDWTEAFVSYLEVDNSVHSYDGDPLFDEQISGFGSGFTVAPGAISAPPAPSAVPLPAGLPLLLAGLGGLALVRRRR